MLFKVFNYRGWLFVICSDFLDFKLFLELQDASPTFSKVYITNLIPEIESSFLCCNGDISLDLLIFFLPQQVDNVTIADVKVIPQFNIKIDTQIQAKLSRIEFHSKNKIYIKMKEKVDLKIKVITIVDEIIDISAEYKELLKKKKEEDDQVVKERMIVYNY
jgi:hypothetical protein